MESILHEVRRAARTLAQRPALTGTVVVTLAVGIGALTAVFGVARALLRPSVFAEPERLVLVWGTHPRLGPPRDVISGPTFLDLQRRSTTLDGLSAFAVSELTEHRDAGAGVVPILQVTPELFSVLGIAPHAGRLFTTADAERSDVVVLGFDYWRRRLDGRLDVIGKPLPGLDGPYTVVGVLPPGFRLFEKPDLVTLLRPRDLEQEERTHYHYWLLGRAKSGASLAAVEQDLDLAFARLAEGAPVVTGWEARVERLDRVLQEPVRDPLLALLAAAGVLVLIACVNVAHLLLAQGLDRRRELALRAALGADRARLLRQLLTESALLAALGALLGVGLAAFATAAIARILPDHVAVAGSAAMILLPPAKLDPSALVFAVTLSALAVGLFGLLPALRAASIDPLESLKAGSAGGAGGSGEARSRRVLVGIETALASLALVSAGLMARTVHHLLCSDPGFRPVGVVTMILGRVHDLDDDAGGPRARYYRAVLESVAAVPGVRRAGLNDYVLLTNEDDYEGFEIEGRPHPARGGWPREEWRRISPDYFSVMGIPLRRGRLFTADDDERRPSVVVVNEAMVRKYWPGQDPVGRRVRITHKAYSWSEVVGVVGDVREVGLDRPPKPMIFVPFPRAPRPVMALFARVEGDPSAAVSEIKRAVWRVDPTRPVFATRSLERIVSDSISLQRLTFGVTGSVAVLAAFLTAVGILGVVRHTSSRARRELALRLALGATNTQVIRRLVGLSARPALLGLLAGLAGSRVVSGLLASQVYGVTLHDPLTLAATALLVAALVLLASYPVARRAARLDPATVLRTD
jgi:putative ABC transport system permease protein